MAKVSLRVPAKPCRTQYAVKCSLTHVKVTSARAYGIREKRKNDVVINELEQEPLYIYIKKQARDLLR